MTWKWPNVIVNTVSWRKVYKYIVAWPPKMVYGHIAVGRRRMNRRFVPMFASIRYSLSIRCNACSSIKTLQTGNTHLRYFYKKLVFAICVELNDLVESAREKSTKASFVIYRFEAKHARCVLSSWVPKIFNSNVVENLKMHK